MLPRPHVTSSQLAKRKKTHTHQQHMHRPIPERGYATLRTVATADAGDPSTELNPFSLSLKLLVWKHFGLPVSYVDNVHVVDKKATVFKLFYVWVPCSSTGSTINMAGHLRRHHKTDLSVKPTPVTQTTLPSSSINKSTSIKGVLSGVFTLSQQCLNSPHFVSCCYNFGIKDKTWYQTEKGSQLMWLNVTVNLRGITSTVNLIYAFLSHVDRFPFAVFVV